MHQPSLCSLLSHFSRVAPISEGRRGLISLSSCNPEAIILFTSHPPHLPLLRRLLSGSRSVPPHYPAQVTGRLEDGEDGGDVDRNGGTGGARGRPFFAFELQTQNKAERFEWRKACLPLDRQVKVPNLRSSF